MRRTEKIVGKVADAWVSLATWGFAWVIFVRKLLPDVVAPKSLLELRHRVAIVSYYICNSLNILFIHRRKVLRYYLPVPLLLAAYGAYVLVSYRNLYPSANQLVIDVAAFLNETPLEPPASDRARLIVDRFKALPAVGRRLTGLHTVVDELCAIYEFERTHPESNPGLSFDTRIATVLRSPTRDASPVSAAMVRVLHLRLHLRQSQQGLDIEHVVQGEDLLAALQERRARDAISSLPPRARQSLDELLQNATGVLSKYAAAHHAAYVRKRGAGAKRLEDLLATAEEAFRAAAETPDISSPYVRMRAYNNWADLLLLRHRLEARADVYEHRRLTGEDPFKGLSDRLLTQLQSQPNPVLMLTLAQIRCAMAHGGSYLLSRGIATDPPITPATLATWLADAHRFLDMALTCGLPSTFLRSQDVHELGLCWLLCYSDCRTVMESRLPETDGIFLNAQRLARTMLVSSHHIQFECPVCMHPASQPSTLRITAP